MDGSLAVVYMTTALQALFTALQGSLQILGKPGLLSLVLCLKAGIGLVQIFREIGTRLGVWNEVIDKRYRTFIRSLRRLLEHHFTRLAIGGGLFTCTLLYGAISPLPVLSDFSAPEAQDLTLSAQAIELTTIQSVQAPLKTTVLNQGFTKFHPGLDLKGQRGDAVKPVMKGTVVFTAQLLYAYGNHVVVDHGGGMQSLYAHLSKIMVKPGDPVTVDSVLGEVGSTGNSTGNHLHLEIIDQGRRINPLTVISR